MSKKFYWSNTIQFFAAVAALGGFDIIEQLVSQEVVDWRSIAVAAIGLLGIALRVKTKDSITF
jgi:hypothetical protein